MVVARFSDPKGKLKDNSLQPYLVTTSPQQQSPRRLARLRGNLGVCGATKVPYHERFWSEAAPLHRFQQYEPGSTNASGSTWVPTHVANKPIEFEGKFEGKDGEPLPPGPQGAASQADAAAGRVRFRNSQAVRDESQAQR